MESRLLVVTTALPHTMSATPPPRQVPPIFRRHMRPAAEPAVSGSRIFAEAGRSSAPEVWSNSSDCKPSVVFEGGDDAYDLKHRSAPDLSSSPALLRWASDLYGFFIRNTL